MPNPEIHQLSAYLLDVHRHASHSDAHEFREWLFASIRPFVRFDSGWIGLGRWSGERAEITDIHLHGVPPGLMEDYRDIVDIDPVAAAASEYPGKAISHRLGSVQFAGPRYSRLRAYTRKYRLGNALCTSISDSPRGLQTFMTLCRANDLDYFSPAEREWHELAMPHLAVALQANRQRALQQVSSRSTAAHKLSDFALVAADGTVLAHEPRFAERLRLEWPGFDGSLLPALIRDRLINESSRKAELPHEFITGALAISIERSTSGWLVTVHLRNRLDRLSARERDIAERFAHNETISGIATALGLAPATVRRHIQRAYDHLDVHNKVELAKLVGGEGRGVDD